jgi:hypothetical protein
MTCFKNKAKQTYCRKLCVTTFLPFLPSLGGSFFAFNKDNVNKKHKIYTKYQEIISKIKIDFIYAEKQNYLCLW